jgi:selenocysteine lyase/cysteine desulfurase
VVFVGPFEHHSNEVSWREGLATVVEVRLDADGGIDLMHLEELLRLPASLARSHRFILRGIERHGHAHAGACNRALLHRYGAIARFDYAASAPYEPST